MDVDGIIDSELHDEGRKSAAWEKAYNAALDRWVDELTDDERAAVINACNEHINIAEVRAPGELTTHEQVAAAVAAEHERCAGVCRSLAKRLPATWGADAAAGCADAIELGEEVGHV